MSVDLPKFVTKAVELYDVWPSLFNWAGGLLVPVLALIATVTWWIRGYIAETEIITLKGKIEILEQRLKLATEQHAAAKIEAENFKTELDELKKQVAENAPDKDIKASTENLEITLNRLFAANNALTGTLTPTGARVDWDKDVSFFIPYKKG